MPEVIYVVNWSFTDSLTNAGTGQPSRCGMIRGNRFHHSKVGWMLMLATAFDVLSIGALLWPQLYFRIHPPAPPSHLKVLLL